MLPKQIYVECTEQINQLSSGLLDSWSVLRKTDPSCLDLNNFHSLSFISLQILMSISDISCSVLKAKDTVMSRNRQFHPSPELTVYVQERLTLINIKYKTQKCIAN